MLVVRVELWPGGEKRAAREIGCLAVGNVSALSAVSSYVVVRLDDRGAREFGLVSGHDRSAGFWPLLAQAATADLPGEVEPATAARLRDLEAALR